MENIERRFNRPTRNGDEVCLEGLQTSIFSKLGPLLGGISSFQLSQLENEQAHRYVLFNCSSVDKYVE